MSLINDALKQARSEGRRDAPGAPLLGVPVESGPARRAKGVRSDLLAVGAVLLLPLLLFAAAGIYYLARPPAPPPPPPPAATAPPAESAAVPPATPVPPAPEPPPPAPAPPAPPPAAFVLAGVLRSGDSFLAILNDRTVRAGDEVDGARVERIDAQGVVLRLGDQALTIPLPQHKL